MTFDLGLALFGLFVGVGVALGLWTLGQALISASANVGEALTTAVSDAVERTAEETRFRSRVMAGIVRARAPKPTAEDVKASPFDAWASAQRGIDQKAMAHLRGSYLLLAGMKGPVTGDRREAALELLATYGAPAPPGA